MKKKIILLLFILFFIISFFLFVKPQKETILISHKVSDHGYLSIQDGQLVDQDGEIMMLRGVSSHNLYWFGDLYTFDNLKDLVDTWNINVFRIALYTSPEDDGYMKHPEVKEKLYQIIDDCIRLNIYVIVDWHILKDNNPNIYENEAISFFQEISFKYQNVPNLLYEICNEPNGDDVTWSEDIKPYAEKVISVIRKNDINSIILVGTANWSKDLESVRYDLIDDSNVIYVVHSYPEGGMDIVRSGMENAFREKIPVIVSECAATDPTGDSKLYTDFFKDWIAYLENNHVSWIVWQFSDKFEKSSLLLPKSVMKKKWLEEGMSEEEIDNKKYHINDYLSESGELTKSLFLKYTSE